MFELVSFRVVSLVFVTLLFFGFVTVGRMLLGQKRRYSNISKTVPLAIISPTVHNKWIFKEDNTNPKSPWCLNLFQLALHILYLWHSRLLGLFLCTMFSLDKKYSTLIFPKLYIFIWFPLFSWVFLIWRVCEV